MFFKQKLGKDRVIWRYDPIIINKQLTVDFHIDAFEKMSKKLSEYTDNCIISFVDPYKKALLNTKDNFLLEMEYLSLTPDNSLEDKVRMLGISRIEGTG